MEKERNQLHEGNSPRVNPRCEAQLPDNVLVVIEMWTAVMLSAKRHNEAIQDEMRTIVRERDDVRDVLEKERNQLREGVSLLQLARVTWALPVFVQMPLTLGVCPTSHDRR